MSHAAIDGIIIKFTQTSECMFLAHDATDGIIKGIVQTSHWGHGMVVVDYAGQAIVSQSNAQWW